MSLQPPTITIVPLGEAGITPDPDNARLHTPRNLGVIEDSMHTDGAGRSILVDRAVNPAERLRQLIQQIEHADELGLDAFGVGEHHRREFLDSAPAADWSEGDAMNRRPG
jgi:hypothetical protein